MVFVEMVAAIAGRGFRMVELLQHHLLKIVPEALVVAGVVCTFQIGLSQQTKSIGVEKGEIILV